jgi:hypothetical protein
MRMCGNMWQELQNNMYIHTCIHAYIQTAKQREYIHTYIHTTIQPYIHTYEQQSSVKHTYMRTFNHTYELQNRPSKNINYMHMYVHVCLYVCMFLHKLYARGSRAISDRAYEVTVCHGFQNNPALDCNKHNLVYVPIGLHVCVNSLFAMDPKTSAA